MVKVMMKPKRDLADDLEQIRQGWSLYVEAQPDPAYLYLERV